MNIIWVRPFLRVMGWLFLLVLAVQCKETPVNVVVNGFTENPTLRFAQEELTFFMAKAMSKEEVNRNYLFEFTQDTTFISGEFSCKAISSRHFVFSGGDPIAITHAVYTFLEELGYTFDISSTMIPEHFDFEKIKNLDQKIVPKVRWRGIRQHVNFPMDISSYPLDEAKEYIRNLVRLRFNKLVVHSYPGFWHEQPQGDSILYAGNFFYDSPHFYKGNEFLKKQVRFNDSLFCIPSMESIYFDKPLKSKKTIAWMNELLAYAKDLGFYIQFSFEPRQMSLDETVDVAHHIIDIYPMIDGLELMTEEMGGWGAACSKDEVEKTLEHFWGKDILKDSVITSYIREHQSDLSSLYSQLGNNMNAVRQLKQEAFPKELKLGIYCTTAYAEPSYYLVRKMESDIPISLMPSHGSDGVNQAVRKIINGTRDAKATEIYSWIEFDGLMYLQQNAIEGINNLLAYMDILGEGQLPSVCFNHWRTCENRVTARFASEASLFGSNPVNGFYETYARRLGIDPSLFEKVMTGINKMDSFSTTGLGNIGFCWTGAWKNSGLFRWMRIENINKGIDGYESIKTDLDDLNKTVSSESALKVVSLLKNRVEASIIYLKAFKAASQIREIDGDKLTLENKRQVEEICNKSLDLFEQYIEKYAKILPDRGSEGVMVSIWNAPMYGLMLIRKEMAGIPLENSWHNDNPVDSPPLPIHN